MFYHWAALPIPPVPEHVAAQVDGVFYYRDHPTGLSGAEWGRARRAWAREPKTLNRLRREITDPDLLAIVTLDVGPTPNDLRSIRRTGRPRGRPKKTMRLGLSSEKEGERPPP